LLPKNRELENVDTVDWKDGFKPVKGGLFDTTSTGGHGGNKWSYIKLHEPMPNPVMEEPIRKLLRITGKEYEDVLAGRAKLGGRTGSEAIRSALAKINVEKAIETTREEVKGGRKGARDEAIKRLGYLKAAFDKGIHPREWVLNKVPVLPPAFRPVSMMQGGNQLISDANYLYKEVWDANKNLKDLSGKVDDTADERLTLYKAFKAVAGLGDPVQPKNQERQVKGMLQQIFGDSPKFGTVQQKLLGTTMDLVGRAVVAPNPDLSIDEVGLPESRAWEVYAPFIIRRLVKKGVGRIQAMEYVTKKNDLAKKALLEELDARPLMVNRAPVLHRYGRMAFYPRLVKGDVLQICPLVVGGFGMDFDGDASNYEVIADDDAAQEAIQKMLPSRNLIGVSSLKNPVYTPRQEYIGGLWSATSGVAKDKRSRTFATVKDALQAYWRGEHSPDDPVDVVE
jgi:DNA-directed RNA polymerase subunit beta'